MGVEGVEFDLVDGGEEAGGGGEELGDLCFVLSMSDWERVAMGGRGFLRVCVSRLLGFPSPFG